MELKDYAGLPAEEDRWVKQRNAVLRGDQGKGWDAVKKGCAQYYSGKALDASLLLMPQASLSSPTTPLAHHPRTYTRGAHGTLVYRYTGYRLQMTASRATKGPQYVLRGSSYRAD
jgi:hypothetical protein